MAFLVSQAVGAAASSSYILSEVYNSTNFFDVFDFSSKADPNGGHVQYQSSYDAFQAGLVEYKGDEMYIGVDYSGELTGGAGRKAVRLESQSTWNEGLFIADFTHLPKPTCGTWPAFWFLGPDWPNNGEVDIYENWNDLEFNRHTAHVASPSKIGECTISSDGMTSEVDSANCYDFSEGQYDYQGCSASSHTDTFGSASGGVFAMEFTSEFIKIWDWARTAVPSDIQSGTPSPSSLWGTPAYMIKQCDIVEAFKNMQMILNIDFCGVAAQEDKWGASCRASTGYQTCSEYVAASYSDFAQSYFKVKDIKIYQQPKKVVQTSGLPSSAPAATSSHAVSPGSSSSAPVATSSHAVSSGLASSVPAITQSGSPNHPIASPGAATISTTGTQGAATGSPSGYPSDEDSDECEDDDEISSYPTSVTSVSASYTSASTSSTDSGDEDECEDDEYVTITATEAPEMTTSTIYATSVHTVASCAPTVTYCPAGGYVTTETISVGTTVCPVSSTGSYPKPTTTAIVPAGYTTSTVKVTKTYTVSSWCAATVTNCPVGKVTSKVTVSTTVYPLEAASVTSATGIATYPGKKVTQTASTAESTSTTTSTLLLPTTKYVQPSPSSVSSASSSTQVPVAESSVSSSGGSSGSSSADIVYITATVLPFSSSTPGAVAGHSGYPIGGYNATMSTSVAAARSTDSYSVGSDSGCTGSDCDSPIVEVSGAVKAGVSTGLAAVLFFLAM
ncbi:concanavalin A-like lectin/glucanase domain-containing protein [Xylariaceae sp. FL0016]|nr:concanavalin A-like lectin/glucanase domain-containing protein [Xylariaceae sp. FL0016]